MTKRTEPEHDFSVTLHGSIALLEPHTADAQDWISEHVPQQQWWAGKLVVEPRYLDPLLEGMIADGLTSDGFTS